LAVGGKAPALVQESWEERPIAGIIAGLKQDRKAGWVDKGFLCCGRSRTVCIVNGVAVVIWQGLPTTRYFVDNDTFEL